MSRKLLIMLMAIAAAASALSASGAEPVTFTRYAYEDVEDAYLSTLYRTLYTSSESTFSVYFENEGYSDVVLLNTHQEPVYRFTVKTPEGMYLNKLAIIANDSGLSFDYDNYCAEILVTQHLFNDDDLYEVVLTGEGKKQYIYNEKGECLGELPGLHLYLDKEQTYVTPYVGGGKMLSLYSINKKGSSVAELREAAAAIQVAPNPVRNEEMVTLSLPEAAAADMTVTVVGMNGTLLVRKECKRGETTIKIPAYRLATGVNLVMAVDAEGNVLGTGKIVKE